MNNKSTILYFKSSTNAYIAYCWRTKHSYTSQTYNSVTHTAKKFQTLQKKTINHQSKWKLRETKKKKETHLERTKKPRNINVSDRKKETEME